MKRTVIFAIYCIVISLGGIVNAGTVLFSDNYNRADNTDIDASSTGMSGTLSPMVYMESFEGSKLATSIQIASNQLDIAYGAGMSCLYLNHNFTDAAILTADGFSITLDVIDIYASDDTTNRFGGFGVGMTAAEAAAAGDINDSTTTMRGDTADQNVSGVCDFFVDIALDNNLRIWHNGVVIQTISVGSAAGTIKAEFFLSDFNAGSNVTAVVYFNGTQVATQTFAWDNTGANYIGISGRAPSTGVFLDNLFIETCYDNKAQNPSPADGTIDLAIENVTLEWTAGSDPNGNSLPGLAGYYVYLGEEADALYQMNGTLLSTTIFDAGDLATDKTYYWKIEEVMSNGQGGTYAAGDPNNIMGTVWSFTTIVSIPVITAQPDDVLADVGGEAQISVGVSSMSTPHYAWYKSTDNANDTPDDDTLTGTDSNVFSISSAVLADEGYYYCKITNAGGSVTSDAVRLGIKRVVASWTLDLADFSGGVYQDSSGEGHDAEPNLVPDTASFVAGADPARTNQGLDLTVKPLAAGDSGVWDPTVFTDEMTISVWCKWAGNNGSYQGVVSKKTQAIGEAWYLEVTTSNTINFAGTDITAMTTAMPAANEWVHLAVTASPVSAKHLYVNGVEKASAGTVLLSRIASNIYLGANNRSQTTGSLISTFNGVLDEVQIYNYAKDKFAVADLYYDIQQIPLCLNPNNVDMQFDIAGGGTNGDEPDCVINLIDFAVFAQHWLDCSYYPQSECQ